jgi:hypothetical protein
MSNYFRDQASYLMISSTHGRYVCEWRYGMESSTGGEFLAKEDRIGTATFAFHCIACSEGSVSHLQQEQRMRRIWRFVACTDPHTKRIELPINASLSHALSQAKPVCP